MTKKNHEILEFLLPNFPGVIRPLSSASFIILYPILHANSSNQIHVWTKVCQRNTIASKSLYMNWNIIEQNVK